MIYVRSRARSERVILYVNKVSKNQGWGPNSGDDTHVDVLASE